MKATVTSVLVLLAISHATLADPAAPDNVPASCLNKNFNVDPFECCKTPKLLDEGTVKECVHSFPPPQNAQDEIKPDVSFLIYIEDDHCPNLLNVPSSACPSA